jgi:hypothetical protein
MNINTHAVRRRFAACAAAAIVLPGLAACGGDLDPPAQNISRDQAEKKDTVPGSEHTSGNRLDFGDEFGKRATPKRGAGPDDRNLNRKDFRDNGL